jgi:NADH-quinone oxidoreductase subunit N
MADQILKDLSLFGPELALTATLLAAILTDLVFRRTAVVTASVVLLGLLLAGGLAIGQAGTEASIFSNMIAVDPFAWYFKLVILLSAVFIVLFSMNSAELNSPGRKLGEYYSLLVAMTLGMVLMVGASNLLMMYLAIELSSLTGYVLSGYTKDAPDSAEASLKYIIYGALSSGLMLYGMSIVYGLTGSLDIYGINEALPAVLANGGTASLALLIAGILITAGLGYKISAVPFHFWAPDVYEGAPITITAFLAVGSKAAGFALMIRFFKVTFLDSSVISIPAGTWTTLEGFEWYHLVAVLSVLTMTVGNLIAIWQNNLKRLLAYSSIAHAGYMLMGVVVLSNDGVSAVLVYFVVYLFMNLGAFYTVMHYKGLGSRAPFVAVSLTIFLIALIGLPPTAGFIGKLYLLAALVNNGWIWLAIVAVLNTVVSLYYYYRVVRNMFLRSSEMQTMPITFGGFQTALLLALVIPTVLFGLYFVPLSELAQASVGILLSP